MAAPAVVLLNPSAGGGLAGRRWRQVEPEVRRRLGDYVLVTSAGSGLEPQLSRRIAQGTRDFIAAGGDGTVNRLLELLIAGADGSVHIVGLDGKPIDSFATGEAIRGLALATLDGRPALLVSDAKSVTALRLER